MKLPYEKLRTILGSSSSELSKIGPLHCFFFPR